MDLISHKRIPSVALFSKLVVNVLPIACTLLSLGFNASAQSSDHSVLIVGNFGDMDAGNSLLEHLEDFAKSQQPFTLVLPGDIIPELNSKNLQESDLLILRRLAEQIESSNSGRLVIVPGDRDWAYSGKQGWDMVQKLEKIIDSWGFDKTIWAIKDGCPGPKEILISDQLLLVGISTQWWNHQYQKPIPADAECKVITEIDFLSELNEVLDENQDKNVLLVGHFPLISHGPSGGSFPFTSHLTPPIIGSFITSKKRHVGNSESIINERFDGIRKKLLNLTARRGPLIYASGHERNLQVLINNKVVYLNSGSPANATYVKKSDDAIYAKAEPGFIELRYSPSGDVDCHIRDVSGEVIHKETLFYSMCEQSASGHLGNTAVKPCDQNDERKENGSNQHNSLSDTLIMAGDYTASKRKQFWFGQHYRTSWTSPTRTPFLDLDTTKQGLTIYAVGGGRQSTSLKMQGGDGREYVFRSVNKDPTRILPVELKGTVISDILKDATSMQHPYGALVVSSLLDQTDVLHAEPELYVLPSINNLFFNKYSSLYGMLEEKPTRAKNVTRTFAGSDDVVQSFRLFRELYKDHDNKVATREYAKARLVDILVGDWGRHEDNWKWAEYTEDNAKWYRPIPRDRDHAFSSWDGVIPWIVDREWAKLSGENFDYSIKDLRSLTWPARHLDRFIASELGKEDWLEASTYLRGQLNDKVIEEAVSKLPAETYSLSGEELENKLKARIKDLDHYALRFYLMLAKEVDVVGSNKKEYFYVHRNSDGSVDVSVYPIKYKGDDSKRLYHRNFNPEETKEIRLYGLSGKDEFQIEGSTKNSILVRVIGGPGEDQINDESQVNGLSKKTKIYDSTTEIRTGKETKVIEHWDHSLYNYNRTSFAYNTYFPLFVIGFNSNDGLGATAGVSFTNHKFGKQDYSSKHTFKIRTTTEGINIFQYDSRFHHVIGKWDITTGAILAKHNDFTYFYGRGNGTEKQSELFDAGFYLTRYNTAGAHIGIIRDFWKRSFFSFNGEYLNNNDVIDSNTILSNSDANLISPRDADLFELSSHLQLDFRDKVAYPEDGMRIDMEYQQGFILNDNKSYGIFSGFMEAYYSIFTNRPLTFGARFGGSTNANSENIPFYKLKYLGQLNNLRGYEENRFTGRSLVFYNTSIRIEMGNLQTSILPMRYGLTGFFDSGRVFSRFDTNNKWHKGYGAGFYLIPLNEKFGIQVSLAFSEEETGLLLLSIGGGL